MQKEKNLGRRNRERTRRRLVCFPFPVSGCRVFVCFVLLCGWTLPALARRLETGSEGALAAGAPATPAGGAAAALAALDERSKALEEQVESLQAEVTDLSARAAAAPAALNGDLEQLHAELLRLTVAIEELHRRLDMHPAGVVPVPSGPDPAEAAPHGFSSTGFVVLMLGLLVGWVLGSRYGRRQERGRRFRIRL
jgi:hypothetical protein